MLQKLNEFSNEVRTCRQRAEDAKRKAERTGHWASKVHFLKMETRWLALARSYELTGVIAANLGRRWQSEERVRGGESLEPQKVVEEGAVDTISQLVWLASIVESGADAILGTNLDGHHHKLEQGRGAAGWLFGRGGHRPTCCHPDSTGAST